MFNANDRNDRSIKKGYLFGTDDKSTQRPIKKRNISPSEKTTQTECETDSDETYFDAQDSITLQFSQRNKTFNELHPGRSNITSPSNEQTYDNFAFDDTLVTSTPTQRRNQDVPRKNQSSPSIWTKCFRSKSDFGDESDDANKKAAGSRSPGIVCSNGSEYYFVMYIPMNSK